MVHEMINVGVIFCVRLAQSNSTSAVYRVQHSYLVTFT